MLFISSNPDTIHPSHPIPHIAYVATSVFDVFLCKNHHGKIKSLGWKSEKKELKSKEFLWKPCNLFVSPKLQIDHQSFSSWRVWVRFCKSVHIILSYHIIIIIIIIMKRMILVKLNSAKVSSAESAESFPKLLTSDEIPSSPQMNYSNIYALSKILPKFNCTNFLNP